MLTSVILTLLTCSQGLLIAATKKSSRNYGYSTVSANLMVELLKLFISLLTLIWVRQKRGVSASTSLLVSFKRLMVYPIPAVLYLVKNLLQYTIFMYVDAPSYQILKNFNVLTTAVLYTVLLNKRVSQLEWCSLLLLTIGCVVSQLQDDSNKVFQVSPNGISLSILMASLSSLAGVYTEKIMKADQSKNINVQNFYLYLFGIFFNSMMYCGVTETRSLNLNAFVEGFTPLVWLMIFNHAFSGIAVAYVLRFNNNLTKVKATSFAVTLTTLMSVVFLNFELQIQFLLGFLVVTISLYIPTLEIKQRFHATALPH